MKRKIVRKVNPTVTNQQIFAWLLNTIIFVFALITTIFGRTEIGILTLICLAIITFPSFISRGVIKKFPVEIELVLLGIVTVQFVIGESLNFYSTIPYFDKLVHYINPLFIGFMSFLVVYSFYWMGNLKASLGVTVVTVSIFTLGIGALWEIIEYSSDRLLFGRAPGIKHFQGSLVEDPLTDTMNDLIFDLAGALFGSILAIHFIGYLVNSKSPRLTELLTEIQAPLQTESDSSKA